MPVNDLNTTKSWSDYFLSIGIPAEIAKKYSGYAGKLLKNKVPVIFSFSHLKQLLGRSKVFLSKAINSPSSFYRNFEIPKKSGGSRIIDAPYSSLLECQKWINDNILSKVRVSENACAFIEGISLLKNIKPHLGAKALLKIDIKDFFPSISIERVIYIFRKLGYSKKVSLYLAKLCTKNNYLPQGAPTSPAISNIIFITIDRRFAGIAKAYNLNYTRYADDLAFSGDYIPKKIVTIIENILLENKFIINPSKTKYLLNPKKKIVTGINVASDEPKIIRERRRKLRNEIVNIRKYGIDQHIKTKKNYDPFFLDRLIGGFCFWKFVEPNNQFVDASLIYLYKLKFI